MENDALLYCGCHITHTCPKAIQALDTKRSYTCTPSLHIRHNTAFLLIFTDSFIDTQEAKDILWEATHRHTPIFPVKMF